MPSGLKLEINQEPAVTAPRSFVLWQNWIVRIVAPPVQTDANGNKWLFKSWSDNGAWAHDVLGPAADTTYTATYVAVAQQTFLPSVARQ